MEAEERETKDIMNRVAGVLLPLPLGKSKRTEILLQNSHAQTLMVEYMGTVSQKLRERIWRTTLKLKVSS